MPCRRKRWRKRSAYCMPLPPRSCVESLPRRYMPTCPLYRPCPSQHALSCSSLSDYSYPGEEYCTLDNCRNAPMCINAQPLYCPYTYIQLPQEDYADDVQDMRDACELSRSIRRSTDVYPQHYPQAVSTPYEPPGGYPAAPAAPPMQNRRCPVSQRSNMCPFNQMSSNTNTPCRQQMGQVQASDPQRVMDRPEAYATQSQAQLLQRMSTRPDSVYAPEPADDGTVVQTDAEQYQSYYPPTHESTPIQNFSASKESEEADFTKSKCLTKERGYCNMRGKCNKELAFDNETLYHTLPEPSISNATGRFGADQFPTQEPQYYKSGGPIRSINDPSPVSYDQSFNRPSEQDHAKLPPETPIPYIHDAVSTCIQTGKFSGPKCPCRYPPAFKHFSCTGNISGICNCQNKNFN